MANMIDDENREDNTWTETPAEDKIAKMSGEAPAQETPRSAPAPERFSLDDIRTNFDSFGQEDVDAMTDEQYANYEQEAVRRGAKKSQDQLNSENLGGNLELADRLGTMADFVIKETEGDKDHEEDFNAATMAKDLLANKTSKFTSLSDEDRNLFAASLGKMYEDAKQRRGHIDNAVDQFVKGYWSTGNMIYQGGLALKPGELTQEDAENISASVRDSEKMDLERPSRIGAVEDIHSVGDAVDYVLGAVGENAVRGAVATGAAAVGAIAAPYIGVGAGLGAIVTGSLGTMAMNTGEAVQDQLNEGRDDGDIRNTRGWALAQGAGYSILDGAFGVSAWGAKIWSGMLRKAGLGQLTKMSRGVVVDAARETARKASLKEVGKDILLRGVVGEGVQEVAQSQGVGRGIRYLQTGSIFKTKEDGTPETPADAFLEAVNEFAGGAAAGLTFGLLGGGMSHVDANRSVKKWNAMFDALNNDKSYQALDDYGKLLVKRRLLNDAFLTTRLGVDKKVIDSFKDSNSEIDAEIARMSDNKDDPNERLIGQSARAYLDIFKSQYSLEDMESVLESDDAKGIESNVNVEEMAGSGRRIFGEDGKPTAVVYTDPNTGISVAQLTDSEGKATGKYVFNNDSSRKSPIFGSDELVCDSIDKAIEKARQLDIYNQWREKKLQQKADVVKGVVDRLFGSRGVQLHFVDRPTKGGVLTGTSPAGIQFDEGGNAHLFVSLDAMDSVGTMYGAFVHERSHQDIVEFLLKSKDWTKEVGGKRVIDWDAFEKSREELFAKVDGAEEASAKYRDKGAEKDGNGRYKTTHEWGKSAGVAGEEMTVTLNSARQLAERLRDADRGIFGGIEDKIRQAIGAKMAYDLGLNPQAVLPSDVSKEMRKIFDLNYLAEAQKSEEGASGDTPSRTVEPQPGAVSTPEQFAARFGKKESPTVNNNDELNLGEENLVDEAAEAIAETPSEKPAVKATNTSVDANGNAHVTVEKTENGKTTTTERTITPEGEVRAAPVESKTTETTAKPTSVTKPSETKTEKPAEKAENKPSEKPKATEPTKETAEAPKAENAVPAAPAKEVVSKTETTTQNAGDKGPSSSNGTSFGGVKLVDVSNAVAGRVLQEFDRNIRGEIVEIGNTGEVLYVVFGNGVKSERHYASGPLFDDDGKKLSLSKSIGYLLDDANEILSEHFKNIESEKNQQAKTKVVEPPKAKFEMEPLVFSGGVLVPKFVTQYILASIERRDASEVLRGIDDIDAAIKACEKSLNELRAKGFEGNDDENDLRTIITRLKSRKKRLEDAKQPAEQPAKAERKSEPSEPVTVNPKEDTVTIPQNKASEPVSVDAKNDAVTVAQEKPSAKKTKKASSSGLRTMPKKTKASVAKKLGINQKVITPEVEDRWMRLNELPEGAKVKVGGKAYVKGESLGANADTVWYSSDKKKHTQTMLARVGEFNVVESATPATSEKQNAKKKDSDDNVAVNDEIDLGDVDSLTDDDLLAAAAELLGDEPPKPSVAKSDAAEPVSVNPKDELTVEQSKRESEIDEALDAFGQFVNDEQRKAIKELSRLYGDVTDIHEASSAKGHAVVVVGNETKIVKPDGNVMTQQEIDEAIAERSNPSPTMAESTFRAVSVLTMPQISSVNAMEPDNDRRYTSLSEDRLLYLAAHDGDAKALRELFLGRFVKKPPKRFNGGLVQWFRDKISDRNERNGVTPGKEVVDKEINKWLWKTWIAILNAMHEGSVLETGKGDARRRAAHLEAVEKKAEITRLLDERISALEKSDKAPQSVDSDPLVVSLRETLKTLNETIAYYGSSGPSWHIRAYVDSARKRRAKDEKSQNPLGVTVNAESFMYSIVNDLWANAERGEYDAKQKRKLDDWVRGAVRRENERLARIERNDRATAFETGKDIATVRKERMIAESNVIPSRYKHMSDKDLVRICVAHDGIPADQMARQEIILRAYEALLKNDIEWKLKENGIGVSAYGDVIDGAIDEIEKSIKKSESEASKNDDADENNDDNPKTKYKGIVDAFSKGGDKNTITIDRFAISWANIIIGRLRDALKTKAQSYEELQRKAGSAVDSYANEQVRALETDDPFIGTDDMASVGPSDSSEAENRVKQGLFGTAQEAAIALMNSGALSKGQADILRALVSAWNKKVNDAYRDLNEALKTKGIHGNRINALRNHLRDAMKLDSKDKSTIGIAAESLGMKPRVYQGRLSRLLDAIELAFLGKDNFDAARREEPMGRGFISARNKFAKGMFGNFELSWPTVQDIKNDYIIDLLGYDENELVGLMERNGDVAMARVVKMAREGKSDSDITYSIDSGVLRENGKNVPNEAGVWTAISLLDRAYKDYGWIDTRISDTKKKVYSEKQKVSIVRKVIDAFGNESDFALEEGESLYDAIKSGRFKELVGKVKAWLDTTGAKIPIKEMPHLLVRAIRNKASNNPVTRAQVAARNKALQANDHAIVSKMMADMNGSEEAVQKALSDSVKDDKRVKSMMTHYRAVERAAAEKARRADEVAKRAAERQAEKDASVKKAEPEKKKTNDDIAKEWPFEQKKAYLAGLASKTGEEFMTDSDIVSFAIEKMGMSKLSANMAVKALRPVAATMTDSELRERSDNMPSSQFLDSKKADAISEELDEQDRKEAEEKARKELADVEKKLAGISQKAKKDSDSVKEAIEAVGKGGVGDLLRRKGLSRERIEEMARNYTYVSGLEANADNLRKMIPDSGESANKTFRGITMTFDVNGAPGVDRVKASGDSAARIIKNALLKVNDISRYSYHNAQLRVLGRDGRYDPRFGIIMSDDLNNKSRLSAFSKAFGIGSPVENGGTGVRPSGNGGVQAKNAPVPKTPKVSGSRLESGSRLPVPPSGRRVVEGIEPIDEEDPGEVQLWRQNHGASDGKNSWPNSTIRYLTTGVGDTNAYFGAKESAKAHGFEVPKHRRVKSDVTDREANDLVSRTEDFRNVVAKAHRGEPLTDVEVRAITLAIGSRLASGINGRLNADEFDGNESRIDELVQAILRAGSTLGSALNQFRHGIDLRTRDTNVWIRAQVRAKLEKEIEDRYGPVALPGHAAEVEAKLNELQKVIDEQAAELQKRHGRIEELQKKVAENESKADDKTIERVRKEAYGEGYRHGEIHAAEEEKKRARENLSGMQKRLGDKIGDVDMARRFVGVSRLASDIFGATLRRIGNPALALTDEMRDFFATALATAKDNDPDIARDIMRDAMSDYDAKVEPYFNLYLDELRKASVPKDGSRETEKKNRKRAVRKRAEAVPDATADIDVEDILDEEKPSPAKADATGPVAPESRPAAPAETPSVETAPAEDGIPETRRRVRRNVGTGSSFLDRLRKRALRAHEGAILAGSDEAEVLNNIGEYARAWFKLSSILRPDQSTDAKIVALVTAMNRLAKGYDHFDRDDAKDALLGRGTFKPISRGWAQASLEQLRKALKLAEAGKVEEAAKAVGIKNTSDSDILQELDRRIGNLLNQKLNSLESRINEDDNSELAGEVRGLIIALDDIRSGKPVGELLDKYLKLAVGMKDYRRQKGVLERIKSRIEMYERKLAENDFEPAPKREKVDSSKELKEIQHEMRNLEALRQRYKHARDAWRLSKKPWLSRQASTILEILGETKAVAGSMDLSSMLRQGGQLTWAHPLLFAKNMKRTLRIFFSKGDRFAEAAMNEIWDRPNADYYRRAGVDFTDWGSNAVNADDRFLLNQYRKFTKWKLLRLGIESSERAFSMYLNMMRADVFDAMVSSSTFRTAENMTDEQLKALGNYINIASQRGAIDRQSAVGKAIPALNAVLWSPRNVISRFQFIKETMKLPLYGVTGSYGSAANDGKMRAMFAKETLRYFTGVASAIMFTKLMADLFRDDDEPEEDIVLNPTSSDFLKVKYGNTRIDFLSGLQQIFVFSSRALTHKNTNLRGETKEMTNPSDYYALFARFARSKFSPAASVIFDTAVARETYDRQEVSYDLRDQLANDKEKVGVTRYFAENVFFPLTIRDMAEQTKNSPIGFAPVSWILTTLGAGVQAFDPYTYKQMSSDYRYFKRLFNESETKQDRDALVAKHPMLRRMGSIDSQLKYVEKIRRDIKAIEKNGGSSDVLRDALGREQKRAINLMAGFSNPMDTE